MKACEKFKKLGFRKFEDKGSFRYANIEYLENGDTLTDSLTFFKDESLNYIVIHETIIRDRKGKANGCSRSTMTVDEVVAILKQFEEMEVKYE